MQTFRCPGNGGQKVNKTSSGVRVCHLPSGASGRACDTRSQAQNKIIAFKRMATSKEFQSWVRLKAAELDTGKTIDEHVDEMMTIDNLKVEVRNHEGTWVEQREPASTSHE